MRVVFLGTSSATPTPRRFLPSVAVVREGDLFLFDCGEGAQIRFRRANLKFSRLRWILISHLHGDHVTGLPGLLMSLQMAERVEPVSIIGPVGIRDYVQANRKLLKTDFPYGVDFTELSADSEVPYDGPEYRLEARLLNHRLPTYGFALVEHDKPGRFDVDAAVALGVPSGPLRGELTAGRAVTLPDGTVVRPEQIIGEPRRGRRLAYVTDTRPCANAVLLGHEADLLIHEATFSSELAAEAEQKRHSTAAEAGEVARLAGAKRLVLTHFSPRYVDLEPLRAEAAAIFPNVDFATDLKQFELEPIP